METRITLSPLNGQAEYFRLCVRQLAAEKIARQQTAKKESR